MKLLLMTSVLVAYAQFGEAQQRAQFTQYMFSGLLINPAYAGAEEALSITGISRNQWNKIEGAPSTQTLTGHTLFKHQHVGIGMMVLNDRIGVHRNLSADVAFAYHLPVTQASTLSFGLQGGIRNNRSDYGSLNTSGFNDPKIGNAFFRQTAFDIGAGVYFRSPRVDVGLSAPGFLPLTSAVNDTLTIRWTDSQVLLFTRVRVPLTAEIEWHPSVLVKYLKGVPISYDINNSVVFRKVLTLGLSYRKAESLDFILKAQLTPQLESGYAYDYLIGEVSAFGAGSHELMVNYIFKYTAHRVTSPR